MDGVSVASGIAGLITLTLQVTDEVYQYVKAIAERTKNAEEIAQELRLLGEVLSQLQDFLFKEKAKGTAFDEDSVLQRSIRDCKVRVERIGDKIKPKEGNKLQRTLDKLTWPFKQEQVLQMMENFRRFRSTFEFAVTIKGCQVLSRTSDDAKEGLNQMLQLSKKTEEMLLEQGLATDALMKQSAMLKGAILLVADLGHTADQVRELSHASRLSEEREQQRQKSDILNWLVPIGDLHKHRDIQAKRSPGTGKWFLDTKEFQEWRQDGSWPNLLCIGGPGVGKSVLCSLVVDYLRGQYRKNDVVIIYYYCDYSEQQSQTAEHLARCILRQACTSYASMPIAVTEFWKSTRDALRDETWFQGLQTALNRVMSTFRKCYLVIDALDETTPHQRTEFFKVIDGIRSALTGLKVFATTRPHLSDIEDHLVVPSRIHVTASEADLRHYLGEMLDRHPDADDILDAALKQEILDKLCENANGMFLLPSLHVRNILDQPTRADVKQALKHLSADLTTVFSSTLERMQNLSGKRRKVAFNTMMWISHAKRPLKVDELQHALSVRFEENDVDRDNFSSLRSILDYCCGLVEVDKDSNIIRLVHISLEEYLQSQEHDLFQNADLTIVRTSLKYMSYDSLKPMSSMNRSAFERALKERPFVDYACFHWGHHATQLAVDQYHDIALPFLQNSQTLLAVARVRDARSPDFRKWQDRMRAWAFAESGGAGVSLAASFGLSDLVRLLISQHKVPNLSARNIYGSTPLHEAAILGHQETAEVLIAHGADKLDQNKGKATPFFLAVSYGRLSMVKTLLKYGRDQLDVHCKAGFTSLHRAADLGIPSLVEYLLQEGALIAAHDDRGSTPLHHASLRGHLEVVKLLVLGGALVDIKANNGFTALDEAATSGQRDVVEFLLDNGAGVSHRTEDSWTPLHRAARGGHVDAVVLLLERGANLIKRDHKGNIPLHHAARAGSLETCVQLLEYDPAFKRQQITATDKRGSTVRNVAFFTAHYAVSKYLRAAEHAILGTEPNTANKMTLAIEHGNIAQVHALLTQEPLALETLDADGQPPLHVAIQESQFEIAKYLLSRGASVETPGYHKWRALHIASSLGNLEMVNLFLAHSADVHARTSTLQTPLHKSASSGSVAVLKRLVAAGAELEAKNRRGMTALHVAAHQNDEAIVRALVLEFGADVLLKDRLGLRPSMWAEKGAGLSVGGWLKGEERRVRASKGGAAGKLGVDAIKGEGGSGRRGGWARRVSGELEEYEDDEDEGLLTEEQEDGIASPEIVREENSKGLGEKVNESVLG